VEGQRLSHYTIVSKIGEGGMGAVYRAIDSRLNRTVAIKVLPPAAGADPDRQRRFVQEAQSASRSITRTSSTSTTSTPQAR
jgi:serine/threonine-protein kinase